MKVRNKKKASAKSKIKKMVAKAAAITALAAEEKRDLTVEEKAELTNLIGEDGNGGLVAKAKAQYEVEKKEAHRRDRLNALTQQFLNRNPDVSDGLNNREVGSHFGVNDDQIDEETLGSDFRLNAVRIPAKARGDKPKHYANEREAYASGLFLAALINGVDNPRNPYRQRAEDLGFKFVNVMTTTDNESAGILAPDTFRRAVITTREMYGVFRQYADVFPMSSGTETVPRELTDPEVYFADQADEDQDTDSDATFDGIKLTAKEWFVLTKVSRTLNEDAFISMADRMAEAFGRAMAKKEDNCGFLGDGTSTYGNITGLKNALQAGSKMTFTSETTFGAMTQGNFISALAKLKNMEGMDIAWYVSKQCYIAAMMRLLAAVGGNAKGDIASRFPNEYLGYPVRYVNVLPRALTSITGQTFGFVGDLRMTAMLGDRKTMSFEANPNIYWKRNQIAMRGYQRADINVHNRGDATDGGTMIALVAG